tara:strand:- start:2850 stop:3062 length:213 start_codon:yes stop_codon:yes gene_type:complete
MKIELNGQVTNNLNQIIDLQELYTIRTNVNKELETTDRKVKIQLLELALELIDSRIVNLSYDMAYAREIE